jgi:hypothetical protein
LTIEELTQLREEIYTTLRKQLGRFVEGNLEFHPDLYGLGDRSIEVGRHLENLCRIEELLRILKG